MGSLSKGLSLLLVLGLAASSLIIAKPACAQSGLPYPSVPQFTLKYVDYFYETPPTTTSTTNPYNGKTYTSNWPSQRFDYLGVDITIQNQPVPPNLNFTLYYNVRTKGHFGEDWTYSYDDFETHCGIIPVYNLEYGYTDLPPASSSQTTVIYSPSHYSPGDQVDFQVQAVYGYETEVHSAEYGHWWEYDPAFGYQTSDWSPTQTVKITESPASTIQSQTPVTPEFSWLLVLLLLLSLIPAVGAFRLRKCGHTQRDAVRVKPAI